MTATQRYLIDGARGRLMLDWGVLAESHGEEEERVGFADERYVCKANEVYNARHSIFSAAEAQ